MNAENKTFDIPYGVLKRKSVPRWWLMSRLMPLVIEKNILPSWIKNECGRQSTSLFLQKNKVTAQSFPILTVFMHEMIKIAEGNPEEHIIHFPLQTIVSQRAQQEHAYNEIVQFLLQPYTLWLGQSLGYGGGQQWNQVGQINLVSNVKKFDDGRSLFLVCEFTKKMCDVFLDFPFKEEIKNIDFTSLKAPVSVNLETIKALALQSKLSLNCYLEMELLRSRNREGPGDHSWSLMNVSHFLFSQEILKNKNAVNEQYDHGLLQWIDRPPEMSIRDFFSLHARERETNFSDGPLFVTRFTDMYAPVEVRPSVTKLKEELIPDISPSSTRTEDNELLFLRRVSEFYESLSPTQRSALERQRQSMTAEQFRQLLEPVLNLHN